MKVPGERIKDWNELAEALEIRPSFFVGIAIRNSAFLRNQQFETLKRYFKTGIFYAKDDPNPHGPKWAK